MDEEDEGKSEDVSEAKEVGRIVDDKMFVGPKVVEPKLGMKLTEIGNVVCVQTPFGTTGAIDSPKPTDVEFVVGVDVEFGEIREVTDGVQSLPEDHDSTLDFCHNDGNRGSN